MTRSIHQTGERTNERPYQVPEMQGDVRKRGAYPAVLSEVQRDTKGGIQESKGIRKRKPWCKYNGHFKSYRSVHQKSLALHQGGAP